MPPRNNCRNFAMKFGKFLGGPESRRLGIQNYLVEPYTFMKNVSRFLDTNACAGHRWTYPTANMFVEVVPSKCTVVPAEGEYKWAFRTYVGEGCIYRWDSEAKPPRSIVL